MAGRVQVRRETETEREREKREGGRERCGEEGWVGLRAPLTVFGGALPASLLHHNLHDEIGGCERGRQEKDRGRNQGRHS